MGLFLSSADFCTSYSFFLNGCGGLRPAGADRQPKSGGVGRSKTDRSSRATQDGPRRAWPGVAMIGATTLYSVETCGGLRTMMQSCASAARLLGGWAHSLPRRCSHGEVRVTTHLGSSWHCITPRRIHAEPVLGCSVSCLDRIRS